MPPSIIIALQKDTVQTALKVCLIVGIILNLINQGPALVNLQWGDLDFIKMGLTFLSPMQCRLILLYEPNCG